MSGKWMGSPVHGIHEEAGCTVCHPVVVLDPEDAEQVERLSSFLGGYSGATDRLRTALREFAAPSPPKPETVEKFRHFVLNTETVGAGGVMGAVCGKVWEPSDDTDDPPCPNCVYAVADGLWLA